MKSRSVTKETRKELVRHLTRLKGLGRSVPRMGLRLPPVSPRPFFKPELLRSSYKDHYLRSADEAVCVVDSEAGRVVIPLRSSSRPRSRTQENHGEIAAALRSFRLLVNKICPSARERLRLSSKTIRKFHSPMHL